MAIKDPTAAVFRPLGGANLLVIGQNEEAARGAVRGGVLEPGGAGAGDAAAPAFTILDGTPDDAEDADYLAKLAATVPGAVAPGRGGDRSPHSPTSLPRWIGGRRANRPTARRASCSSSASTASATCGRRRTTSASAGAAAASASRRPASGSHAILRDGPPVGIHVIVWCDSLTNLNRTFDRPQLREFALRVLFQMSATDSSTLMDTPAASQARPHAGTVPDQEEQERPEKFRPYGLPQPSGSTRRARSSARGSG